MKKETKKLLIESAIAYVLVYIIHLILIDIGYRTFDYCVTHVCGVTHNVGYQDILWLLFFSLPWICIIALILVWINYLDKKPKTQTQEIIENVERIEDLMVICFIVGGMARFISWVKR